MYEAADGPGDVTNAIIELADSSGRQTETNLIRSVEGAGMAAFCPEFVEDLLPNTLQERAAENYQRREAAS